jgi:glycosyltransferase involved in cell wall biosynthesis
MVVLNSIQRYGVPIVVDDGSSDQTSEISRKAGAVIVRHETRLGYDQALNSGFARAHELGFGVIITIDADGQHDPKFVDAFLQAIDSGADVALGVRDRHQRLAETLFAKVAFWRLGIEDPLCGMKAYRTKVFVALGHFDSYKSVGTELALFAAKNGFRLAHIPILTRDRFGKSRFGLRFAANMRIFRALWLGLFFPPSRNCCTRKSPREASLLI